MPLTGKPILSTRVSSSSRRNDLADRLLDFGELPRAFLDPRADVRAHVHQDLPGIDRREEVAAEIGRQRERAEHEQRESELTNTARWRSAMVSSSR